MDGTLRYNDPDFEPELSNTVLCWIVPSLLGREEGVLHSFYIVMSPVCTVTGLGGVQPINRNKATKVKVYQWHLDVPQLECEDVTSLCRSIVS